MREIEEVNRDNVLLLTGRIRPFDRDEILFRKDVRGKQGWLKWIEAGRSEDPEHSIFVVATQTVEVGADLDFDALVTEAAPLDCLRQRFGRLDRMGRLQQSEAAIIGRNTAVAKTAEDPIYGKALAETWKWIGENLNGKGKNKSIDFGFSTMEKLLKEADLSKLCVEKKQAPVMLPAHTELCSRTNPSSLADPDISLFLHGPESRLADVQVVWRVDLLNNGEKLIEKGHEDDYISVVSMLPPTSMEICPVPISAIRYWLETDEKKKQISEIADVEGGRELDEPNRERRQEKFVLCWRGPENSQVVRSQDIRPGDTIIVPCSYGGYDEFGWNPGANSNEVTDVAECCTRWGRGRAVLRSHPNVVQQWIGKNEEDAETVAPMLPQNGEVPTKEEVNRFLEATQNLPNLPIPVRDTLKTLLKEPRRTVPCEIKDGSIPGWLFKGSRRLKAHRIVEETSGMVNDYVEEGETPQQDDASSFTGGGQVLLTDHTNGVIDHVKTFAHLVDSNETLSQDLILAAQWHDIGKLDTRFQAMLHEGDEVNAILALANGTPLAKSDLTQNDRAAMQRARHLAGVPKGFRHEAFSVVLLRQPSLRKLLQDANDRELVEYLIGTHHGHGRPSHPVSKDESPPEIDTYWNNTRIQVDTDARQKGQLYRLEVEWESLFARMNRRYGIWGLAWLEAIFRLADQMQSFKETRAPKNPEEAIV